MNNKDIWDMILERTGDEIFTAALMGNMYAESGLKAENLQNSHEKKLGFTDATYTAAVDSGAYPREKFVKDSAGYGLCQWTHWSRKAGLYDYAKTAHKSIGDMAMQIDFCAWEMSSAYKALWNKRGQYKTIRDAVADILRGYERPADQSDANIDRRTVYAQGFFDLYSTANSDKLDAILDNIQKAIDILKKCFT